MNISIIHVIRIRTHSGWWPYTVTPSIHRTLNQCLTFTDLDLISEFEFLPNCASFPKNICNGCGMLTPLDTMSCPIWDFCSLVHTTDTQSYITPVYDTFPWFDFLPTLTFLLNIGFRRAFATCMACRQGTLTPPDTWSCPTLTLACALMSRPISPEHVLFLDFWVSNIPRYFCFAFWHGTGITFMTCS